MGTPVELKITLRAGPVVIEYESEEGDELLHGTVGDLGQRIMSLAEIIGEPGTYVQKPPPDQPAPPPAPPPSYTHTNADEEELEADLDFEDLGDSGVPSSPIADTRTRIRPKKDKTLQKFLDQ